MSFLFLDLVLIFSLISIILTFINTSKNKNFITLYSLYSCYSSHFNFITLITDLLIPAEYNETEVGSHQAIKISRLSHACWYFKYEICRMLFISISINTLMSSILIAWPSSDKPKSAWFLNFVSCSLKNKEWWKKNKDRDVWDFWIYLFVWTSWSIVHNIFNI